MAEELSVVGKRVPLQDAYEKVTGSLKFAVDFDLSGMLVAKVLRSPHPHARIVNIDTSKAEALPGVAAVITHKDVPEKEWQEAALNYRGRVLDEKVRFVGDEVAAVAAVDAYVAEEALNLIEIEWEELPSVFAIMEAMKPDAPQINSWGNVRSSVLASGDIVQGFKEADLVVEHSATMGIQQYAPIGRNACIASWDRDKLTLWTSTQAPFQLRDSLARILDLPQNKIRVIDFPISVSQGIWWYCNFQFIAACLAKKARKPVKLELTQEECFATVKSLNIISITERTALRLTPTRAFLTYGAQELR